MSELSSTEIEVLSKFHEFTNNLLEDYWEKYPDRSGDPIHRTLQWSRIIPGALFGSWGPWDSKLYHLVCEFRDYRHHTKGFFGLPTSD